MGGSTWVCGVSTFSTPVSGLCAGFGPGSGFGSGLGGSAGGSGRFRGGAVWPVGGVPEDGLRLTLLCMVLPAWLWARIR